MPCVTPTKVRELVGAEGHVIGAVSGGVDSSVAAVLMKKAIGEWPSAEVVVTIDRASEGERTGCRPVTQQRRQDETLKKRRSGSALHKHRCRKLQ